MGIAAVSRNGRCAVFLDRDGVLNLPVLREGKPYPPARCEDLVLMPGVHEALSALRENGFLLYVVTNQPDVARGTQRRSEVEAMHAILRRELPLDGVYVCYHDDADACGCRKPGPGLLAAAAAQHGISLADSYMIGDRWRDVEAGRRAGCRTVWIHSGYSERGPSVSPDATVDSLTEAVHWILEREKGIFRA
jgi:D-glycero-D-manno-heptose 1,7-bisphosphate phosphatase